MLKVHIQSLSDSGKAFSLEEKADNLPKLFDVFFGTVRVECHVKVHSDRYTLVGKAKCMARLECDLSLNEYEEEVVSDFELTAIKGEPIADAESEPETLYVPDDQNYIDISEAIGESLSLALPMKRIAPEFRGKELKDIHPERAVEDNGEQPEGKDTWAALKKIKLN